MSWITDCTIKPSANIRRFIEENSADIKTTNSVAVLFYGTHISCPLFMTVQTKTTVSQSHTHTHTHCATASYVKFNKVSMSSGRITFIIFDIYDVIMISE